MKSTLEHPAPNEAGAEHDHAPENPNPGGMAAAAGETRATPARTRHIGRIVAGSLVTGVVAAMALVAGPLAGAREHVITGSVLITFSVAWAVLAVLSERWTEQPQRWAITPAVLMATSGIFIVVFAPKGNQLGWIWPPTLAALTVWMVFRSRRELRSRTRVWLVYPVFAALMVSSVGGAYETYRERVDAANFPMPGRLVDVGGHRLHINCSGTGSPTVVLEPGLGEPSTAMAWIAPAVASTTRVCVYDRAGRGWSESASAPQDGIRMATDLHTLLERAHEPGPYVLAGHSAGGIYVLNYASLYPNEVAGVVLLDSMHPEQYTRIASWPGFYEMFRRASGVLPALSRLGVGRVLYANAYSELPESARDEARTFWSDPRHSRSLRDEFSQLRTAMAQARSLTSLGNVPLVVLTAEKDAEPGWMAAQTDLLSLSTQSAHRLAPGSTHAMLTENQTEAARSSQAVSDVVNSIRTRTSIGQ